MTSSLLNFEFPDPSEALEDGLVAYGGDLHPLRILQAYKQGIFPWYSEDEPILWWSPDPRLILIPDEIVVRKSLKKVIKNKGFEVKYDTNFKAVIESCSNIERVEQDGTWILPEMIEAYLELHKMGYAHSVEVYLDNELVGGLYGISLGRGFFGESMFSKVADASKVALVNLCEKLKEWEFDFIDCQVSTEHLISMGAKEVSRDYFLSMLEESNKSENKVCKWN